MVVILQLFYDIVFSSEHFILEHSRRPRKGVQRLENYILGEQLGELVILIYRRKDLYDSERDLFKYVESCWLEEVLIVWRH